MAKDIKKLFARLTFLEETTTQVVGVNKPLLDFIGHEAWAVGKEECEVEKGKGKLKVGEEVSDSSSLNDKRP
ncbi:hypothetical protein Golob_020374, partial [Gossypium lobatum]|nr:hypothetical protein [Gossypium lobatum]